MVDIEYLDSQHNVVCNNCGTTFCINIGDIYVPQNAQSKPHCFRVYCPKCRKQGRVEALIARQRGYYEAKSAYDRLHENHSVRLPENINAQESVNQLLAEVRAIARQLFCLRRCALHVINTWAETYNRGVLYSEMTELQRTIKEIDVTDPDSVVKGYYHNDPQ